MKHEPKIVAHEIDAVALFERAVQPLIERMRSHFEAQDDALLAMHPGVPISEQSHNTMPNSSVSPTPRGEVE